MMGGLLHLAAACAIVTGITWNHWIAVPAFFVLGFFWEKTQHRYYWEAEMTDRCRVIRTKTGWFGWVTKHRAWEAAGWGLGGLLAAIVLELTKRVEVSGIWQ
jgi:hypothetical protein